MLPKILTLTDEEGNKIADKASQIEESLKLLQKIKM